MERGRNGSRETRCEPDISRGAANQVLCIKQSLTWADVLPGSVGEILQET